MAGGSFFHYSKYLFSFLCSATKGKARNKGFQTNCRRKCSHTEVLSIHGCRIHNNIFYSEFSILWIYWHSIGKLIGWRKWSGPQTGNRLNLHLFQAMAFISVAILLASYQFMAFMSKAKFSESGAILDSGNDLNIEGGIAEWVIVLHFCIIIIQRKKYQYNNQRFFFVQKCQRLDYTDSRNAGIIADIELVLVFVAVGAGSCRLDAVGICDPTVAQPTKRTTWNWREKTKEIGPKNEARTKIPMNRQKLMSWTAYNNSN